MVENNKHLDLWVKWLFVGQMVSEGGRLHRCRQRLFGGE